MCQVKVSKEPLGYKQQLIMQCIWDVGGEATKQDIMKVLEEKHNISMTRQAINMSTQALLEKRYLEVANKLGNAYIFRVLVSREEFQKQELKRFINLTFDGSTQKAIEMLLQNSSTQCERKLQINKKEKSR